MGPTRTRRRHEAGAYGNDKDTTGAYGNDVGTRRARVGTSPDVSDLLRESNPLYAAELTDLGARLILVHSSCVAE